MTKHRLYNFKVFFTASDVYSAEGHQLICLSGLCPRHFSWMDQLHNDAKNKKENIINEEKKKAQANESGLFRQQHRPPKNT